MKIFNPLICAVLGAMLGYYGIAPFRETRWALPVIIVMLALLAASFSFFRILAFLNSDHYSSMCRSRCAVFLAAGFILGIASLCTAARDGIVRLGLTDREITGISGILLDDPRISSSGRGFATLKLNSAAGHGGLRVSARGKVTVFFPDEALPRLKEFGRRSAVFVEGSFAEVRMGRGRLFRAKTTHIVKGAGQLDRLRTTLRQNLVGIFEQRTWGGLALALLLGVKDNLDNELAAQYRDAGCSYILALSGMHLAIVSSIIAFLLKRPLGLKPAAALGAVFVLIYIYLVGPQPSLVRAGISYLIGALAIFLALKTNAIHIVALSFLVQLIFDPASGLTISFMLSYLALAGILIAGEPIGALLRGRLPALIAEPLSASLGAFVATMAITIFYFGNLRIAGIFAGLVMVPLTTLFMIGSIIFLVLSIIPPLAHAVTPLFDSVFLLLYRILETTVSTAANAPAIPVINKPIFVILSIVLPFALIFLCAKRIKARNTIGTFD
ncbi:MAG: ComEC/Rec2 family competence protein [Spirochaetaceae bacterium]|jgi:competence protein ComEC|nr:ComEC/Rec2 family competence protein [Spirochaetaceae bacterium]